MEERRDHWTLYRDSRGKMLNVERAFSSTVAYVESFSNGKWTIRGGGQDLRSRQLSEVRKPLSILGVATFHGSNNFILDEEKLKEAKDYV